MLTRMYNLGTHCPGLPLGPRGVPWLWVRQWSLILERDLDQRRLRQKVNAAEAARRAGLQRGGRR